MICPGCKGNLNCHGAGMPIVFFDFRLFIDCPLCKYRTELHLTAQVVDPHNLPVVLTAGEKTE